MSMDILQIYFTLDFVMSFLSKDDIYTANPTRKAEVNHQ